MENKNTNKNFLFPPSHHIIKQNVQERREPNERPRRNGFHGKDAGQKAYQRQAPVNGSLELLPLCNMNCDMCYVRLSKAEMEQKAV